MSNSSKTVLPDDRYAQALVYHERVVERNTHVEHGVKAHLVQDYPALIVMVSCPCGRAYTTTNERFSAGDERFYELMKR